MGNSSGHSGEDTAHMHNMARFAASKLLGSSKYCLRKSKDRAVTGKRSFKHRVSDLMWKSKIKLII